MWGRPRNKYGNKPVKADGVTFHSRGELGRWRELQLLQEGRAISNLKRQVRFSLKANGKHICFMVLDYAYTDQKRPVVEDFKSPSTRKAADFIIKKKLFEANYPDIEFRISQRRPN
ncbi:MAG: DUF1064 domain-containing protein [Alphaproteobacteria bacterium]|nr:DUF1064 domain-containing protein [Alphaproteobacteria bacterium]